MHGIIYAYDAPKSEAQREFTARRIAQSAEQRRLRKTSELGWNCPVDHFECRTSHSSAHYSVQDGTSKSLNAPITMAGARRDTAPTNHSAHSDLNHQSLLSQPFELRYGRRYLREVPYPLPCDLAEIQRQNLRTMLVCEVFGRAVCAPSIRNKIPMKVLEVGCGSGYWSAACHDYFSSLNHHNVAFTGLDIAPLAPDHRKQGVNWTFVQHDLRRMPWPFDDGEFDLVMMKDLSLALPQCVASQGLTDEGMRVLGKGGILEIWESDHVVRTLLPHPPPPPTKLAIDQDIADATATYLIAPGTPFAPAHNKYIRQANAWLEVAFSQRRLTTTPCTRIAQLLLQEPDSLGDVGWRRVAIPLSELRWEQEWPLADSPMSSMSSHDKSLQRSTSGSLGRSILSADQLALRQAALLTVLQQIESLEPLMKEVSGKSSDAWVQWWAGMMTNLMTPDTGNGTPALAGEALEMGAWWATKLG